MTHATGSRHQVQRPARRRHRPLRHSPRDRFAAPLFEAPPSVPGKVGRSRTHSAGASLAILRSHSSCAVSTCSRKRFWITSTVRARSSEHGAANTEQRTWSSEHGAATACGDQQTHADRGLAAGGESLRCWRWPHALAAWSSSERGPAASGCSGCLKANPHVSSAPTLARALCVGSSPYTRCRGRRAVIYFRRYSSHFAKPSHAQSDEGTRMHTEHGHGQGHNTERELRARVIA